MSGVRSEVQVRRREGVWNGRVLRGRVVDARSVSERDGREDRRHPLTLAPRSPFKRLADDDLVIVRRACAGESEQQGELRKRHDFCLRARDLSGNCAAFGRVLRSRVVVVESSRDLMSVGLRVVRPHRENASARRCNVARKQNHVH